jgi:hypothetical protein
MTANSDYPVFSKKYPLRRCLEWIPLLFFTGLQPKSRLDRDVFGEFANKFSTGIDHFLHQRALIHGSTPFVASVIASYSF